MFGFEPLRKQVTDPDPAQQLDLSLALEASQEPAHVTRPNGGGGQEQNQLESQLQNEANGNQVQNLPGNGGEGSNETFLVSGSLSRGLSAGAAPDSGFGMQFPGGGYGAPGQPGGGPSAQAQMLPVLTAAAVLEVPEGGVPEEASAAAAPEG